MKIHAKSPMLILVIATLHPRGTSRSLLGLRTTEERVPYFYLESGKKPQPDQVISHEYDKLINVYEEEEIETQDGTTLPKRDRRSELQYETTKRKKNMLNI
ncbi:hypothetical protein J6590_096846 [Homalodisca vitripennis]|nr:hypothetical protein J6590_096846 [Homalodisca vitripennis]